MASSFWRFLDDAQQPHNIRWDSLALPDNTQPSQWTNIHASGQIRTKSLSRRVAADPRRRPRGHWDLPWKYLQTRKQKRRLLVHECYSSTTSCLPKFQRCCEEYLELFLVFYIFMYLTFRDLMSAIVDVPHCQPPKFHFIYLFNKYSYWIF